MIRRTSTFTPKFTGNGDLDDVQQAIARAFEALELDTLLNPATVTVLVGTGDTKVYHGLGRPIRGRVIIGQDVDARIWDGTASTEAAKWVNLKANTAVTVTVLFF